VTTVVGPGGEALLTLAETMDLLHLSPSQVTTLENSEKLHRVQPAALPPRSGGRGRGPTVFFARSEVESYRQEQLAELGAVEGEVLVWFEARRAEVDELRAENERLTERLARLTEGPQDVLRRRLDELDQRHRDLNKEVASLRKAHRAAVRTVRSLGKQLDRVTQMYQEAAERPRT
jgi:cell division protein FtsB